MTRTTNYQLIATIESNDHEIKTLNYQDVRFETDDGNYGNGTYLFVNRDLLFDIRYDTTYDGEHEIAYLADWASRRWNGKRGAWKLIGIQITSKVAE